jgi:hypothetical protein
MKRITLGVLFFVLILSIGSSYAAILVSNQSATYTGPTTAITFRMNTYGFVTVYIKDTATGTTIQQINPGFVSPMGSPLTVYWDGTKSGGSSATTGEYYAVIEAVGNPVNAGYKALQLNPILFTNAASIAFNKNSTDTVCFGRLYVTDWSTKSVYMYYPDGTFIRATSGYSGGWGWGAYAPYGIDIDQKSLVWVTDRSNMLTRLFTPELNYLRTVTGGGRTRMDTCVTGDTTSGALYMVWGEITASRVEKSRVTNGTFDVFQYICPISPSTTTLRSVLATQDNATVYTAQLNAAPAVKQFTGTNYTYAQTGWTTAVDSAFALDFTPDEQYLWVATLDTAANLKKVRISDGTVVDSVLVDTTYAGCIAVDVAGNIAVLYGNMDENGKPKLNIWQPPDTGSQWIASTNPFHFNSLGNIPPSINSTIANPISIPSDGTTPSLLTIYAVDPDGYTDDTALYIDVTSLGGSANQPFVLVSGNTTVANYTTYVTAVSGSAVGSHSLPVYVIDSGGNIGSANINVYITAGFISGNVTVEGSSVDIQGATITATGATGPYTTISGPTGSYQMDAAVGSYTVSASKIGWDAGTVQTGVIVGQGSTTSSVNVTLTPKTVAAAKALPLPATVAVAGVTLAPRGKYLPLPYGLNEQYYIADEGSPDALRIVDDVSIFYPQMGQKVVVEGDLAIAGGYTEMRLAPSFSALIGTGRVVAPVQINVTDVATTNFGKFVTLSNVTVGSVIPQPYYSRYTVFNAAGRALVYYENNSTINDIMVPLPVSGDTVTVTGIISQLAPGVYTPVIRPWYIGRIDISPSSMTLVPSQTQLFTASSGTPPYLWSSNDTTIGTIDTIDSTSGLFTALSAGTCSITVTDIAGNFGWEYIVIVISGTNAPLAPEQNTAVERREIIGEMFK